MLYQLVLDRKPKVAYQIGTFVGYSALVIADALRANGGGILLAVDPEVPHRTFVNPVDVAREMARARGLDKYIRFERGWHCVVSGDYISIGLKRRVPIVGAQVLDGVRTQGVDLAFIDGDHATSSTLADFLLLRDYLNVNGIAVFHDAQSSPRVAQAIFIMWHDNFYWTSNTARYFAIDVHAGKDGLAILKRIRDESHPTLCLIFEDQNSQPIPNVKVEIPSANFTTVNGEDGKIYVEGEFSAGLDIRASCRWVSGLYRKTSQGNGRGLRREHNSTERRVGPSLVPEHNRFPVNDALPTDKLRTEPGGSASPMAAHSSMTTAACLRPPALGQLGHIVGGVLDVPGAGLSVIGLIETKAVAPVGLGGDAEIDAWLLPPE